MVYGLVVSVRWLSPDPVVELSASGDRQTLADSTAQGYVLPVRGLPTEKHLTHSSIPCDSRSMNFINLNRRMNKPRRLRMWAVCAVICGPEGLIQRF